MKRKLMIIAVLALLMPGVLLAQDEITLEGLAEQVGKVVEHVADLAERVAALEQMWTGPGAMEIADGVACVIGENTELQDETVLRYKEQFGDWPDLEEVVMWAVVYNKETGYTVINFTSNRWGLDEKRVAERWDGCEFVESPEWWEVE